jgi:CheY-like chemotaxis protein/tetratricopeptide (TPR) repeat protein
MAQHTLLLVESDAQHLRVMEVSLRKAGYVVTTARDGADALAKLGAAKPDLIVSDTALANVSGFDLCQQVKRDPNLASIPFLFLTKDNAVDSKVRGLELGADDYLIRPVYTRDLADRIQVILGKREREAIQTSQTQRRFFGDLDNMSVVDLLQAMELGRKSGALRIDSGSNRGTIWFRDGQVIDANAGTLQGEDAVYRMLTWDEGSFEADFRPPRRPVAMTESTQTLLMEGLRRTDDWGRIAEQLPSLDTVFTVDYSELADHLTELEDSVSGMLRLFDGQRSAREVIAAVGLPDLEALDALSQLYFEGIIAISDGKAGPTEPDPVPEYEASVPPAEKGTLADALLRSVTDGVATLVPKPDVPAQSPPPPPPEAFDEAPQPAVDPPIQAPLVESTADSESAVVQQPEPPPTDTKDDNASLWELAESAKASQERANSAAASLEMALMQEDEEVFPEYEGGQSQVADLAEEDAFFSLDEGYGDEEEASEQPFDLSGFDDEEEQGTGNARIAIGLITAILVGGAAFLILQDRVEPIKTPASALKTRWTDNESKSRQPVGSVRAIDAGWQIPSEPDGGIEPLPEGVVVPTEPVDEPAPEPQRIAEEEKAESPSASPTKEKGAKKAKAKAKPQAIEVPKINAKDKANARSLTAKAIKLYKKGKYKDSVTQYEKALAVSPGSKAALVGYTKALLEVNRIRDALEAAEKAARIDRNNAEVFLLLGNARQELGMSSPSIKAYERYLKLDPNGRFASEVKQVIKGMRDGLN